MNTPLLSLQNVTVRYGKTTLFDGMTIDIVPGSINALLGENGSGKSTLLHFISGTNTQVSGNIFFEGEDIGKKKTWQRSKMGIQYVGQHGEYRENMTVLDNCLMGIDNIQGGKPVLSACQQKILTDLLERTGLQKLHDTRLSDVSFGQKKMTNLIKNIVMLPNLLLLDEPFAGIHETMISSLLSIFDIFRQYHITVILVEHKKSLYASQCDTIVSLPPALVGLSHE